MTVARELPRARPQRPLEMRRRVRPAWLSRIEGLDLSHDSSESRNELAAAGVRGTAEHESLVLLHSGHSAWNVSWNEPQSQEVAGDTEREEKPR
jgi:hypothetical protein